MRILISILVASFSAFSFGAGQTLSLEGFETSQKTETVIKLGELSAIQSEAQKLFDQGQCEDAIPELTRVWEISNDIANTITSGLDPFYDADRDATSEFMSNNRELFKKLAQDETNANKLKAKRNLSMVMIGECHIKLGQTAQGLSFLRKALDLIDIGDLEMWNRARTGAFEAVGYDSGQTLNN